METTSAANTNPMIDLVSDYAAVKDRLLRDLDRLGRHGERIGLTDDERSAIEAVLERGRKQTFVIAVVGEFKRGKSTFMNTLLEAEILPTDTEPCSAAVNRVRYGPRPAAQVVYRSSATSPERVETIELAALRDYVTQLDEAAAARAATIKEALIYYPLPFLRDNDLIDTPGLNDSPEMTAVTYGILPEVDAAVMVVVPHAPFGKTEEEFLNHLLAQDVGRVIFVVNQIDKVRRPADRERVLTTIATRIRDSTRAKAESLYGRDTEEFARHLRRIGEIKVYGLSAREAILARRDGDYDRLERSGLPVFEAALREFLTTQRGTIALSVITERILTSGAKLSQSIAIQLGALALNQQQFTDAYNRSIAELDSLTVLIQGRLDAIDLVTDQTSKKVRAMVAQLGPELQQIADAVIAAAPITPADLESQRLKAIHRELQGRVREAIAGAHRTFADRLQILIAQELQIELDHLNDLAVVVSEGLQVVTLEFAADSAPRDNSLAAFATERLAGGRMLAAGGIGGLVAAVGLVVSWPIVLMVGIASVFGAGWLSQRFLAETRIDQYKAQFRQEVHAAIDKQLREQGYTFLEQADRHVRDTFESLKRKVRLEFGDSVEQARRVVDETRLSRERGTAHYERDQADFMQIDKEIGQIVSGARTMSAEVDRLLEKR